MPKPLDQQSPEELITYIKSLRQEAQQHREAAETYSAAFERLSPAEQRGMLHMVRTFAEDNQAGAELFRDIASRVLGDNPPPTETKEEDQEMADNDNSGSIGDDAPAWAKALEAKVDAMMEQSTKSAEQAEKDRIAEIKADARSRGFVEGTEEWTNFFHIAGTIAEGDLDVAQEWYESRYGGLPGATEEKETEEGEAESGAEVTKPGEKEAKPDAKEGSGEEGGKKFPKSAKAGGAGAPGADQNDAPDLSKQGVASAAMAYLDSVSSGNAATP